MKKGFTIIELLVSLGIFVIITTMVIANFRAGSRSDELKVAADALGADLGRAQNMSLSGELVNGAPSAGGFGVYFILNDPTHYILFADLNDNQKYDAGEDLPGGKILLPKNVSITSVQPSVNSSVVFKPPKPVAYINGGTADNMLIVVLQHALTGKTKKIILNRISGRIDIE